MLHKVALFLWPTFNKLKMMTPTEVSEVHAHVRTLLEEGGEAITTTFENEEEAHTSSTVSPPAAKRKRSSFFAEWENADDDDDLVPDEINLYISQRHMLWLMTEICLAGGE